MYKLPHEIPNHLRLRIIGNEDILEKSQNRHCVKSVPIQSNFWSVFSHIRTEYGPEITPYLDTFHAVRNSVVAIDS